MLFEYVIVKVTSSPGFRSSESTVFANITRSLDGSELATGGSAIESATKDRKRTNKCQRLRFLKNRRFILTVLLNTLMFIILSPNSDYSSGKSVHGRYNEDCFSSLNISYFDI